MKNKEKNILKMAKAIYQTVGIQLFNYTLMEEIEILVDSELDIDLLFSNSHAKQYFAGTDKEKSNPRAMSNDINCYWIIIPKRNSDSGWYIMGPILLAAISEEQVKRYYFRRGVPGDEVERLAKEYQRIPIVSFTTLMQFVSFFLSYLYGYQVDLAQISMLESPDKQPTVKRSEEEIYNTQMRDFFYIGDVEQYIMDNISQGNVENLKKHPRSIRTLNAISALSTDENRSMKNNIIISIAIMARAAIKGGLPMEVAYPLSDSYIIRVDAVQTVNDLIEINNDAMLEFAKRVRNNQYGQNYSKVVRKCIGHVSANVNKRIKISDLAQKLELHPDTLSRKFKKETGITLIKYIRNVKMKEAEMLLCYTDKKLTEIVFLLGYTSQSQFIEAFKKFSGTTPNQYRMSNKE